jgi:hypothetical protein
MSRLVKLEKMLERGLGRLRHPEASRELIEAIPDVLDDVEDHLKPSGGRGRVLPYPQITVVFRVPSAERPAARALMQDLPERIRQRLRTKGFEPPVDLVIQVRYVASPSADWGDKMFRIRYHRRRPAATATRVPVARQLPPRAIRLLVIRGRTGEKEHRLALARINLGRLEKVSNTTGKIVRKNHVWFAATEDTVSRAHAHIERMGLDHFLFDEGSASGTRVLRASEEIELMPRATRGVRLEDGDRIELGRGCVIEVRMTKVE